MHGIVGGKSKRIEEGSRRTSKQKVEDVVIAFLGLNADDSTLFEQVVRKGCRLNRHWCVVGRFRFEGEAPFDLFALRGLLRLLLLLVMLCSSCCCC